MAEAVPHAADADAAPQRLAPGVEAGDLDIEFLPVRSQRGDAVGEAGGMLQLLARCGQVSGADRVDEANLQPVEPALGGQDRKSTRLNSSPYCAPRMPSSA